jgi:hypothetical protein
VKVAITLVLLLFARELCAQKHTISGYVRDADSRENLIGATVYDQRTRQGGTANAYGFYSITLLEDSVRLAVSYVGYKSQTFRFLLSRDTVLIFNLEGATTLDEVIIESERAEKIQESSRMGTVTVPITQVKKVPAFMGEADVMKVLQLLPGVQGGNEGTSGLYVRGGGPDQNLILLDGVPVYNPSHLYGFFSSFNPDALNYVELVKGGFPARYGGRLSSVVDISMKEGNQQKFHATGSIGLISAKLAVEGPIIKDRTSFMMSGRMSYLNLLSAAVVPKPPGIPKDDYRFYDFNLKVNHRLNNRNRIFLSGYTGRDHADTHSYYGFTDSLKENRYDYYSDALVGWGNSVASIRWNHVFGKRLFANLSANYTSYQLDLENKTTYTSEVLATGFIDSTFYRSQYTSGIRDYMARLEFDFVPNPRHYVRFGSQYIRHHFAPGALAQQSSEVITNLEPMRSDVFTSELNAFFEDDFEVTRALKVNAGIHASAFLVDEKWFNSIQPRLSVRYLLTDNLSAKASLATMQQYVHLLSNSGLGMPTDLWVPATAMVPPQKSWQASLGAAKMFGGNYEFTLEGFYKSMQNVVEYQDGASYLDIDTDWQTKVSSGSGRSYGMEAFFQKKIGNWSGWIGYTLSWTDRQFDDINDGEWFYYRYDRRHDIKLTSSYGLGKHWDFSATWIFGTGNVVTIPTESYRAPSLKFYEFWGSSSDEIIRYPARNNFRMRNYHRLDINASYKIKWRKTEHWLSLSIYNVYDRRNPFYVDFIGTAEGEALRQKSLFPFTPSISYSFKL